MSQNISSDTPMLTKQEVIFLVQNQIAESLFVNIEELKLETLFEEDLCADRTALADCIDTLEEEFVRRMVGFSLDDRDFAEIETIGDLVELICERVFPKEYNSDEANNG